MAHKHNYWPNEIASAGRENLDTEHAVKYDANEDASTGEELALLKNLGLNGHSVVVGIGAGTGQFSLAISQACARVVAVDVACFS